MEICSSDNFSTCMINCAFSGSAPAKWAGNPAPLPGLAPLPPAPGPPPPRGSLGSRPIPPPARGSRLLGSLPPNLSSRGSLLTSGGGGGPGGCSGRPNPPGPLANGACAGGPSAIPGLMGIGGIIPAPGGGPCIGCPIIGPPPPKGGPPGTMGGTPGGGPCAMPKFGGFGGALCNMLTANSGSMILKDDHTCDTYNMWRSPEYPRSAQFLSTYEHITLRNRVPFWSERDLLSLRIFKFPAH